MKTGAPIKAVTTPIGIGSSGDTMRVIMSDRVIKAAPPTALNGSSTRLSGVETILIMCGTTSPTNPIVPQTATHAAVATDDAVVVAIHIQVVFIPV